MLLLLLEEEEDVRSRKCQRKVVVVQAGGMQVGRSFAKCFAFRSANGRWRSFAFRFVSTKPNRAKVGVVKSRDDAQSLDVNSRIGSLRILSWRKLHRVI